MKTKKTIPDNGALDEALDLTLVESSEEHDKTEKVDRSIPALVPRFRRHMRPCFSSFQGIEGSPCMLRFNPSGTLVGPSASSSAPTAVAATECVFEAVEWTDDQTLVAGGRARVGSRNSAGKCVRGPEQLFLVALRVHTGSSGEVQKKSAGLSALRFFFQAETVRDLCLPHCTSIAVWPQRDARFIAVGDSRGFVTIFALSQSDAGQEGAGRQTDLHAAAAESRNSLLQPHEWFHRVARVGPLSPHADARGGQELLDISLSGRVPLSAQPSRSSRGPPFFSRCAQRNRKPNGTEGGGVVFKRRRTIGEGAKTRSARGSRIEWESKAKVRDLDLWIVALTGSGLVRLSCLPCARGASEEPAATIWVGHGGFDFPLSSSEPVSKNQHVASIAWGPWGQYALSVSPGGGAVVVDVLSGEAGVHLVLGLLEEGRGRRGEESLNSLECRPVCARGDDGGLLETAERLGKPAPCFVSGAFSADGKGIALGTSHGSVFVCDAFNGFVLRELREVMMEPGKDCPALSVSWCQKAPLVGWVSVQSEGGAAGEETRLSVVNLESSGRDTVNIPLPLGSDGSLAMGEIENVFLPPVALARSSSSFDGSLEPPRVRPCVVGSVQGNLYLCDLASTALAPLPHACLFGQEGAGSDASPVAAWTGDASILAVAEGERLALMERRERTAAELRKEGCVKVGTEEWTLSQRFNLGIPVSALAMCPLPLAQTDKTPIIAVGWSLPRGSDREFSTVEILQLGSLPQKSVSVRRPVSESLFSPFRVLLSLQGALPTPDEVQIAWWRCPPSSSSQSIQEDPEGQGKKNQEEEEKEGMQWTAEGQEGDPWVLPEVPLAADYGTDPVWNDDVQEEEGGLTEPPAMPTEKATAGHRNSKSKKGSPNQHETNEGAHADLWPTEEPHTADGQWPEGGEGEGEMDKKKERSASSKFHEGMQTLSLVLPQKSLCLWSWEDSQLKDALKSSDQQPAKSLSPVFMDDLPISSFSPRRDGRAAAAGLRKEDEADGGVLVLWGGARKSGNSEEIEPFSHDLFLDTEGESILGVYWDPSNSLLAARTDHRVFLLPTQHLLTQQHPMKSQPGLQASDGLKSSVFPILQL
uniref:Uncharacterized protein n=1 Tax=Chromera velia CCMP2878 TaxID=1169474 RepID=A0A0G4F5H5_9ALVE|eukprot:Cvel_15336.t1-p1 / transcript=Cvel_15336.t1 / gene=Cvel_15336 / organism=Chromera_velia_CCMP2878 / gene_product=hypothetical protein / transcript_product=hypothetical protein / location=Cvel_scaffold1128:18138-22824(-) / protein_length=1095 / sequence_SO=supercontig / SO=protein_coding / is_pseudo=false